MAIATAQPPGSYLSRSPNPSGLADVLNIILDKGIVIDAYVRVSLVGIELLTIDARIVDRERRHVPALRRGGQPPRPDPDRPAADAARPDRGAAGVRRVEEDEGHAGGSQGDDLRRSDDDDDEDEESSGRRTRQRSRASSSSRSGSGSKRSSSKS